MKKIFFFAAMAAVALASCSNDETVEVNGSLKQADAISFRPFVNGLTRSSSTSDLAAPLASFYVTAFNHGTTTTPYINAVKYVANEATPSASSVYYVDGTSAAGNKYNNEYYWPAGNLDFYAYAYTDASSQVSKTAYNQFVVTPNATAGSPVQVDLIFATIQDIGKTTVYETTKHYGADGVPLNFRHTGAKIACKVKNSSSKLKFDVEGWKIGYLDPTGTFTLSETSTAGTGSLAFSDWTATTSSETTEASIATEYSSTFEKKTIAVSTTTAAALDGEMIIVPQAITATTAYANSGSAAIGDKLNNSYIAVKLIIRNNDGGGDDTNGTVIAGKWAIGEDDANSDTKADASEYKTMWAIWPIGGYNLEPGKKYTFTIDLADGGYYETNQDANADLDPILEGAIIKFVSVTVDSWGDVAKDATPVTGL